MDTSNNQAVFKHTERAILVSFAFISFCLGFVGYQSYYELLEVKATFSDLAYMSVNLFFLQMQVKGAIPFTLDIARWIAPITLSYALIKTAMSLVQNKLLQFKVSHLSEHAIIIGLSDHSVNIALSFIKSGIKTVVIDSDENNKYWGEP